MKDYAYLGWLEYCVPEAYGGRSPGLDVRALCLIRETLAYHSGLADFSFAMQGLGEMALDIDASALLIYRAAWTKDQGAQRVTREAAMAKLYAAEAAKRSLTRQCSCTADLAWSRAIPSKSSIARSARCTSTKAHPKCRSS